MMCGVRPEISVFKLSLFLTTPIFLSLNPFTTMKTFIKFVLYSSALLALMGAGAFNLVSAIYAHTLKYPMAPVVVTVGAIAWVWIAVAFLRYLVNGK